ncbi:MAG: hypothetical protein V8R80_12355 [Eubacterium sp.]
MEDLIRSVCKPYGFTPRVQPVHSTDVMIMGVQCGLGVAVTDIWCRALNNSGFDYLTLDSTHSLSMVWTTSGKMRWSHILQNCCGILYMT